MAILLGLLGIFLLIFGAALLSVPAALIVAGLICIRAAQAFLPPSIRSGS